MDHSSKGQQEEMPLASCQQGLQSAGEIHWHKQENIPF